MAHVKVTPVPPNVQECEPPSQWKTPEPGLHALPAPGLKLQLLSLAQYYLESSNDLISLCTKLRLFGEKAHNNSRVGDTVEQMDTLGSLGEQLCVDIWGRFRDRGRAGDNASDKSGKGSQLGEMHDERFGIVEDF